MTKDEVLNMYFEWLISFIQDDDHCVDISYRRLLMHLHNTEFTWIIEMDSNRAEYGIGLRFRFGDDFETRAYLNGPCSVLEMMIALSLQCEENIMTSPDTDDKTSRWFWEMIDNLGLSDQFDGNYDKKHVDNIQKKFLNRRYRKNGQGGLFYVENADCDMRDIEIWTQMLWHLDEII